MYCVDIEQAARFARLVYPDLEGASFEVPAPSSENYTLLTKDEVVRIARTPHIAECMHLEVHTLLSLQGKLSLPTPVIHDFQPDNQIMRMSRLPGTSLSKQRLNTMPELEKNIIARQIGQFMVDLHHEFSSDREFLKDAFKSHREDALKKAAFIEQIDLEPSVRIRIDELKKYITEFEDIADDCVRIHADIVPANVLYDDQTKQLSIVDFTGCRYGFRHQEFRKTLRGFPPDIAHSILENYESISGRPVSRLAHIWRDLVKMAEHILDGPGTFAPDPPVMKPAL